MSYFLNNTKYNKFIIDEQYLNTYNGLVELPLIEIFNKDEIEFDFTNVVFECSDPDLKGRNIAINKIHIDYGDGSSETLHEVLKVKSKFLGNFVEKNWKTVHHTFFTEQKHIYQENLIIANYPKINITFFNQFNDRYHFSIPYKILYKSFYDDGTSFNLMDANINNNNISSFTLREKKNNALIVVSAKNYTTGETYFSNPSFIIDESDDYFVDDDTLTWNWSTLPEIYIDELNVSPILESSKWSVNFKWREKNINLYDFSLFRRPFGSPEEPILITKNFIDLGYEDIIDTPGIYEYIFDLVGINNKRNIIYLNVNCSSTNPCTIYEHETFGLIHPISIENINSQTENVVSSKTFDISFELPTMGQTNPSLDIYKKFIFSAHHTDKFVSVDFDILKNKESISKDNKYYTLNVRTDTIPDGKYNISLAVEDITGNTGNTIFSKNENGPISNFYVSYVIGAFDEESFIASVEEKDIHLNWKFFDINVNDNGEKEPGNADYFEVTLTPIS